MEVLSLEVRRAAYRDELRKQQEERQRLNQELINAFAPIRKAVNELVERGTEFCDTDEKKAQPEWRKRSLYSATSARRLRPCSDGVTQYSFRHNCTITEITAARSGGAVRFGVSTAGEPRWFEAAHDAIAALYDIVVRYEVLPDDAPEFQYLK